MSDTIYFDLIIPAPKRLALMRADFAKHATRYPHCPEHAKPKTWRDVRAWTLENYESAFVCGLHQNMEGWHTHGGEYFRNERYADNIVSMRHTGWFTDTDGRETARGIVASLTHGRFIAGYEWSSNGERFYFSEVFTDDEDAARMADEHARVFAEDARKDAEKWDEARECESELDTVLDRLRECLALRNKPGFDRVRDEVSDLIDTIRACRERLAGEFADYV